VKRKIWRVKKIDPLLKSILSEKLGVSPIVAQLLINRGIYTVDAARNFLSTDLNAVSRPELLKDIDKAVKRICTALEKQEKILIYGDYDADGITATALLVNFLRRLGGTVNYFVPHRINEGYGLHLCALDRAKETGHTLVITVDCGISAFDTVKKNLESNGPDIIITDHHEPPEVLPPALAVINPKRPDCDYPFKELAGVGVAMKLGQAVEKATGDTSDLWKDFLDLVCLGTVADVVPLKGENRTLVKIGLRALANTTNVGLQALLNASSIKTDQLDTRQVAFAMVPRLNAAGRLGDACLAVDLLLSDDYEEALEITSQLNSSNQRRQKVGSMVLAEAMGILESRPELAEKKVVVLGSETWHPGVIGIVASRIVEKFYRPTLLIALDGDTGKGSARSIPGFHMYKALEHCKDKLSAHGGHALAAGFSLPVDNLEAFREAINNYADTVLTPESMIPDIELDALISLSDINAELIEQLDKLWPYGQGNPYPLFGCHEVSLLNYRGVGKEGAHLKMMVKEGQVTLDGIGFNLSAYAETLATRDVDLAFIPAVNQWNGRKTLQLEVKEIQPAVTGIHPYLQAREEENDCVSCAQPEQYKYMDNQKELFLPGFINKQLAKCTVSETGFNYSDITVSALPPSEHPFELDDRRNFPHGEEMLARVCTKQENTVVIVNCPYQSIELFSFLTRERVIAANKVVANPLLYGSARDIINNSSSGGQVRVLLSTADLLCLPEGFCADNLVLYNLPYHPQEFYTLLSECKPARVCLLYNRKENELAEGYLHSMAPEREFMAGFYNYLRAASQAYQTGFSAADAISALSAKGLSGMHPFSIGVALKVFKELNLLNYQENDGFRFELYTAPKEKLRLEDSPTYSYLQGVKRYCIKWRRLGMDFEDISDLLEFV